MDGVDRCRLGEVGEGDPREDGLLDAGGASEEEVLGAGPVDGRLERSREVIGLRVPVAELPGEMILIEDRGIGNHTPQ